MRMRRLVYIFWTLILLFMLAACGSPVPKETQVPAEVSTAVETTTAESESITAEDVVTTEAVESTGQSETAERIELSYQVVHRGTVNYKDWEKRFALFSSREDIDKLEALDPQILEKYDEEWFKTHSFVLILTGNGSCCFNELNRVELDGKALKVYTDCIHKGNEQLYQEKGKDFADPNYKGTSHHEDYLVTSYFIEFDRNGEEMMELIDKVIYKGRQYPSSSWSESELSLREPEPPVLETESIPFVAKSLKARKDAYWHDSDEGTYTEWGNKVVTSALTGDKVKQCFFRDKLNDTSLFLKTFEIHDAPRIFVMIGMNPSYRCEMQKVSIDGATLRLYADAVYEGWDELTEAEQAAVKATEQDCEVGLDTHKYEILIGLDIDYRMEYAELMRTIETCVLTVRNIHTGEITELELKYFY